MPFEGFSRESNIVVLAGDRRCGKTFNQRGMLHWQRVKFPARRHLIDDRLGQFAQWRVNGGKIEPAQGSLPIQHTVVYRTREQLWTHYKRLFHKYTYHVVQGPEIGPEEIVRAAMWSGGVNVWLDEIDAIAGKSKMEPAVNELVQRGAHFGTSWYEKWQGYNELDGCGWGGTGASLICAIRRLEEVHNSIIAGCTTLCVVQSTLHSSNKRIALELGEDFLSLDKRLRNMEKPNMLRYDVGKEIRGERPDIWVIQRLSDPRRQAQRSTKDNDRNGDRNGGSD